MGPLCKVPTCNYPVGQCEGWCAEEHERRIDMAYVDKYDIQKEDMVNHPPHYKQGDVECIDAIKAALTEEEWRGYLKGNVMKYIWRERHKGGAESVAKAQFYLDRLL